MPKTHGAFFIRSRHIRNRSPVYMNKINDFHRYHQHSTMILVGDVCGGMLLVVTV